MEHSRKVILFLVVLAPWATGCIVTADPGRYVPDDCPARALPPARLSVGVIDFQDQRGGKTDVSRRLTKSFSEDLESAGIFSSVAQSSRDVDIILTGQILTLRQPIPERSMDDESMGFVIPMTISSLGILPLLGIPTDCGDAEAAIIVRALDPRFGQELRTWHGKGAGRSCSGLYYRGWPLSKALSRATGEILEGLELDARVLTGELRALKAWYRAYGLVTEDDLRKSEAVPVLIRALGDQDERVRVRAVASLGALGQAAASASPALVGCLVDEDGSVRRESILALRELAAVDQTVLRRIAKLRAKSRSREIMRDINRATRLLKFLQLADGQPTSLSTYVAALGELSGEERAAAAKALGALGDRAREALPALMVASDDPDPGVRLQVVRALESVGAYEHAASRTALSKRANVDRRRNIREAAKGALRRLDLLAMSEGGSVHESAPVEKVEVATPALQGPVVAVILNQDTMRRVSHDQLADYLAVRLTARCGYRIVPQERIQQHLISEKKKSYKRCYDQRCQVELGKAVAAENVLAMRIFRTGPRCVVTANLYDLSTETTKRGASARVACTEEALMGGIDEVALQLANGKRTRP